MRGKKRRKNSAICERANEGRKNVRARYMYTFVIKNTFYIQSEI